MKLETLEKDFCYHIFNRGINGEVIFRSDENMAYFLRLVEKYLTNKATIFAYCLMNNHYHFAIRVETDSSEVTQAFSNLFNAYAKAFNKMYNRTGSLFEKHFHRIRVLDENYLRNLIVYIHKNPTNHKVSDFRNYPFSSYQEILNRTISFLEKKEVIDLFENEENYRFVHEQYSNLNLQAFKNNDLQGFKNLVDLSLKENEPEVKLKDLQGGLRQHLAGQGGLRQHLAGQGDLRQHLAGQGQESATQKPDGEVNFQLIQVSKDQSTAYFELIEKNRAYIAPGFPGTVKKVQTLEDAEKWLNELENNARYEKGYAYFIQEKSTKSFIGFFDIRNISWQLGRCEFSYFVDQHFQGKGITSKIVAEKIAYCFEELHLDKIIICTSEANIASQTVALKNGFQKEGVLRNEYKNHKDELEDVHYFGLLKEKKI